MTVCPCLATVRHGRGAFNSGTEKQKRRKRRSEARAEKPAPTWVF